MGKEQQEIGKSDQQESTTWPGIRGKAIKKVGNPTNQGEWRDRSREPVG